MENNNTFFDTWMDAQTKLTKNWAEMNEKVQKSMIGGEMMEKGSELYKEWLEKQKSLLNNLMSQPAATSAGETSGATEPNAATNAAGADFFQNWFNMQNEAATRMLEASRNFYENFTKSQQQNNPWQNWNNNYGQLFGNMNKAFGELPKFLNPATVKDAFESVLKSSDMYTKMYEMWQPLFQHFNKNGFDAENMKKMFDPTAYKGMIDQMFGFTPTHNLTQLFEQTSKTITNWYNTTRQLGDSYLNAFGKERDLLEGFMPAGAGYISEMYRNLYNGFRQSMMPFFRLAAPGKEQEQLDAIFELQEKMVKYSVKQNEMQFLIYTHAGKAWNEVMNLLKTRAEAKKEYANFQEFYAEWSDINEKIFIQLFATEEFSRLQGELLSIGLDLKKGFEMQMETMLEPYPVVLKSQMDEVYRSNYELRKEVRSLQKTVKELSQKLDTLVPASKTTEINGAENKTAKNAPATSAKK